jgi:hypothetical protein
MQMCRIHSWIQFVCKQKQRGFVGREAAHPDAPGTLNVVGEVEQQGWLRAPHRRRVPAGSQRVVSKTIRRVDNN